MTTLLRIDASSRTAASHSRRIGDRFEAAWLANHPGAAVVRRDLAAAPPPHIADETIVGYYTATEAMTDALRSATALSDALIAELNAADALLVTTPMYNFSVPSALKAWIDQVVRIGRTFSYDGQSFAGLVGGKPAYIACAYGAGGYLDEGPMAAYDLLRPYLSLVLGFIGFTDIRFLGVEGTNAEASVLEEAAARAGCEAEIAARAA